MGSFNRTKKFWLGVVVAGGIVAGCAKDNLIPLDKLFLISNSTGTAEVNFCTTAPTPKDTEVDYFFVVDMSGSNKQNLLLDSNGQPVVPIVPKPGTNPNGNMSFGAINTFLTNINNTSPNDPYNYFSLLEFSTAPTIVAPLTNNLPNFQNLVQSEWTKRNFSGWTNYTDTFLMIQQQVQNIINVEKQSLTPKQHVVQVVFTSDGAPYVLGANNQVVLQDQAGIVNLIKGIENLVSKNPQYVRSIVFNTIYFYVTTPDYTSYDSIGVQLLTNIAAAGYGHFYDAGAGQVPDYSSFIVPKVREPFRFSDLYVRDMNTAWASGRIEVASDGLIADSIKVNGGADIKNLSNPDSDYNGVRDIVEYTVHNHQICNGAKCSKAGALHYESTLCGAFFRSVGANGAIVYSHNLVPQGMFNDCELKLLDANLDGTNLILGTGVPQDLAELMFYPVAVHTPANWLYSAPFGDNYTGYQRIKYLIDPTVDARDLIGLKPYNYQLEFVGQSPNLQDCYKATVDNMSLSLLPNDTVRAYLVEVGVQSSTPQVRSASKFMDANGKVIFNDIDLQ